MQRFDYWEAVQMVMMFGLVAGEVRCPHINHMYPHAMNTTTAVLRSHVQQSR